MKKWLFLVAVLLFAIYALRFPQDSGTIYPDAALVDAGAVWDSANTTRTWVHINTNRPVHVSVSLFTHPVSNFVYLWNSSDSPFLSNLSATLSDRLRQDGFSVDRFSFQRSAAPAPLLFLDPLSGKDAEKVFRQVERGWAVLYAGPPFNASGYGFSFQVKDALKNEVRLEASNESVIDRSGWQVLQKADGFFAYRPKSFELFGKKPALAAQELAFFISQAGWSSPLAEFQTDLNASGTVFSPPFSASEASGYATLQFDAGATRYPLSVKRPALRVFVSTPVVWPDSVELSLQYAQGPVLVRAVGNQSASLGRFVPRDGKLFAALPTANLSGGEYRVLFQDPSGLLLTSAYVRVEKWSARMVFSDPSSRTFFMHFDGSGSKGAFRKVRWKNQTAYTDETGVAKFKEAVRGETTFYLDGTPVSATLDFEDPFFSPGTLS